MQNNITKATIGASVGALSSSIGGPVAHLTDLKYNIIPRINDLIQITIEANEALKRNAQATVDKEEVAVKLKRD